MWEMRMGLAVAREKAIEVKEEGDTATRDRERTE